MADQAVQAHVIVDEETEAEEVDALEEYLANRNIPATVEASYPSDARESMSHGTSRHEPGIEGVYSNGDTPWTVLVHTRINELASALGPDALRDALDGLRTMRGEQTETSPASGMVFLVDEETGVRFDIEFQLPLHAYAELGNLRISSFRADPVSFHRKSGPTGRWRPPS